MNGRQALWAILPAERPFSSRRPLIGRKCAHLIPRNHGLEEAFQLIAEDHQARATLTTTMGGDWVQPGSWLGQCVARFMLVSALALRLIHTNS